ncbi:MAG: M20 family metallopeptidase [Candidatus Bipolaricaulis sp.]|nr:M20 family metallopeptidase [Candidatus Bipolaricaulis sp.]
MGDAKARAVEAVDALEGRLRSVSREIFEHPEEKFEEVRASKLLADELRAAGFEVDVGTAGLATAIRAIHPSAAPGPTVAILGEYDALPELGHACGHNLIAAGALGAALAVASVKRDVPGRLVFLGTPAEEGGGGKVVMIEAGAFRGVDAAMMFHPASFTAVDHGSLAITEVRLEFRGVAAHASASPEKGVNALDAVIQTFNGINALRQHIRDGARIHGIITNGGAKPNIVPEYAAAEFYVRAAETSYRDELLAKLERCAKGAALAAGATFSMSEISPPYKAMRPNRALGAAFTRNLESLGWAFDANDLPYGSTDMGDVSQAVPAIHAYVAVCDRAIAFHSRGFAEASQSERGHQGMLAAAKAMAMTTVDVLTSPDLVRTMQREFRGE